MLTVSLYFQLLEISVKKVGLLLKTQVGAPGATYFVLQIHENTALRGQPRPRRW